MKVVHVLGLLAAGVVPLVAYDAYRDGQAAPADPVPAPAAPVAAPAPAVEDRAWIKPRDAAAAPAPTAIPTAAPGCDGRTHCSQMTSCSEATHFLRHCPGTQMDGDGDGIPCEQQWCGG